MPEHTALHPDPVLATAGRDDRQSDASTMEGPIGPVPRPGADGTMAADTVGLLRAFADLVARPAEEDGDLASELLVSLVAVFPAATAATLADRPPGRAGRTIAASHRDGAVTDRLQFEARQGPLLDAFSQVGPVGVHDLLDDRRWPILLMHPLRGTAARSVLSVRLPLLPHRPVLSLYAEQARAFGPEDLLQLDTVCAATQNALAGLAQRERARNLHRALMSNRRIGVAVGILMALHRWTDTDAFAAMSGLSQQLNRKLVDIADEVTLTGALPAGSVELRSR